MIAGVREAFRIDRNALRQDRSDQAGLATPNQVALELTARDYIWESITNGHFYSSPSSMACSTCPYANACRQWEG
ncbi:MAG: hypothetical protein ACYSVY_20645 [Planctomycetota bacterium]